VPFTPSGGELGGLPEFDSDPTSSSFLSFFSSALLTGVPPVKFPCHIFLTKGAITAKYHNLIDSFYATNFQIFCTLERIRISLFYRFGATVKGRQRPMLLSNPTHNILTSKLEPP
jgi:hypothetical protein